MNTQITMKTVDLLKIVSENREKHRDIVVKAFNKYREMAIKQFELYIKKAKNGQKIIRYLNLTEPKNHIKDYDLIINMLKAHVDETIVVDSTEYMNYVLDNWSWSEQFSSSNSAYL